jgi:hypothetical protein
MPIFYVVVILPVLVWLGFGAYLVARRRRAVMA